MDYFEQLRQGGPSYLVYGDEPTSYAIHCRDPDNDSVVLEFQTVASEAKAHEDGEWEVQLGPSGGFTGRPIPGWQGRVYLMASLVKQRL
ncbi:hypothetical protein [Bradyrhizobium elkanii]|uniref:hypothetical protein n=1 Tax=Bradyrhizobium elkanii TaxID=29448 RepID=UPI00209F381C|nr:hypothetical protein [Bradyrhizobium elkanii]MCP1931784.1 hypothetical protein [Bradyrhizobium elkanii]